MKAILSSSLHDSHLCADSSSIETLYTAVPYNNIVPYLVSRYEGKYCFVSSNTLSYWAETSQSVVADNGPSTLLRILVSSPPKRGGSESGCDERTLLLRLSSESDQVSAVVAAAVFVPLRDAVPSCNPCRVQCWQTCSALK